SFRLFCFFFFQAEDGIRDGHVTGVQTCALPISYPRAAPGRLTQLSSDPTTGALSLDGVTAKAGVVDVWVPAAGGPAPVVTGTNQIGRASCRERGWGAVGAGGVQKKKRTLSAGRT